MGRDGERWGERVVLVVQRALESTRERTRVPLCAAVVKPCSLQSSAHGARPHSRAEFDALTAPGRCLHFECRGGPIILNIPRTNGGFDPCRAPTMSHEVYGASLVATIASHAQGTWIVRTRRAQSLESGLHSTEAWRPATCSCRLEGVSATTALAARSHPPDYQPSTPGSRTPCSSSHRAPEPCSGRGCRRPSGLRVSAVSPHRNVARRPAPSGAGGGDKKAGRTRREA